MPVSLSVETRAKMQVSRLILACQCSCLPSLHSALLTPVSTGDGDGCAACTAHWTRWSLLHFVHALPMLSLPATYTLSTATAHQPTHSLLSV